MTIVTLVINDLTNPVEIQTWLDANPSVTIQFVQLYADKVFIIYK